MGYRANGGRTLRTNQEDLALHVFLRARSLECLRQHVRLAAPRSINDALQEAERAEAIFLSRATLQHGHSARPHVRGTGHKREEEDKGWGWGACLLAHMQDPCIISLDLLACWGAQVDVPRARLTVGS